MHDRHRTAHYIRTIIPILFLGMMGLHAEASGSVDWRPCSDTSMPRMTSCPSATALSTTSSVDVECAHLPVALDHLNPSDALHAVDVCRTRSADAAYRRGNLLLLPDDSDLSAGDALIDQIRLWRALPGGMRDVEKTFDVVTIAPRELKGPTFIHCASSGSHGELHAHRRFGLDTSAANLDAAANRGHLVALACSDDPMAPFIGIRQRVGDIEALRSQLADGIEVIYAKGQGTWTAARYVAVHPDGVRRVLLDRPVDFTATRWGAMVSAVQARGELYRSALSLVTDTIEPRLAFARLPEGLRMLVDQHIAHPHALRNTLHVGRCMAAASDALRPFCAHGYGGSEENYLPGETLQILATPSTGRRENLLGSGVQRTHDHFTRNFLARACTDDDSLRAPMRLWRARVTALGERFPLAQHTEGFAGMVCSHWPASAPPTPVHPDFGDTPVLAIRWRHDSNASHADIVAALARTHNGTLVVDHASATDFMPGEGQCSARIAHAFVVEGHRPTAAITDCPSP